MTYFQANPPLIPDGNALDLSHTGVPWLDTVIDASVAAVVTLSAVFSLWKLKVEPILKKIRENTAVTREHTENSHGNAPNPNLRDDLDAKHAAISQRQDVQDANLNHAIEILTRLEQAGIRRDKELSRLSDISLADREEVRAIGERLDRHLEQTAGLAPIVRENQLAINELKKKN